MNRTPKEISLALKTVYADNIIKYQINHIHIRPHPAELLAILLLADISNYEPASTSLEDFYRANKSKILKEINRVIKDFHFNEEELLLYNKNPIIMDDNFILIQVFSSGIEALYYACINKDKNPIDIFNDFCDIWGCDHILESFLQGNFSNETPLEEVLKKKKVKEQ